MIVVEKPHGRVWENRETMLLLQNVGGTKIYKQNYYPVQKWSLYGT